VGTGGIPDFLRALVRKRAKYLCEYCLIHEKDTGYRHRIRPSHIDHVIAKKYGGATHEDNLALACAPCSQRKGTNIASIALETGELVRLFNPRTDRWRDHFRLDLDGITIVPLTPIGEVTCRILGMNDSARLLERQALRQVGRYPAPAARRRLSGPD
jgi:HNH endonuclease